MPTTSTYPLRQGWFACPSTDCPEESYPAGAEAVRPVDPSSGEWTAPCPTCGEAGAEMWHSVGSRQAIGKQTGPKTPEGKANLTGPRTPEGKFKSSANGYLHGAHARRHLIPPAKPGEYSECETCPVRGECEASVEDARGTSVFVPCTTLMNLQEKYLRAAIVGSPTDLLEFQGLTAARAQRIIHSGLEMILADGLVSTKTTRYGKDTIVEEVVAHSLLKPITDLMKQQGYDLSSWRMTPASQDDGGRVVGFLGAVSRDQIVGVIGDLKKKFEALPEALLAAERDARADPVAVAYKASQTARDAEDD